MPDCTHHIDHTIKLIKDTPNQNTWEIRCELPDLLYLLDLFPNHEFLWNLASWQPSIKITAKSLTQRWLVSIIHCKFIKKKKPGHWVYQFGYEPDLFNPMFKKYGTLHPSELTEADWKILKQAFHTYRKKVHRYRVDPSTWDQPLDANSVAVSDSDSDSGVE